MGILRLEADNFVRMRKESAMRMKKAKKRGKVVGNMTGMDGKRSEPTYEVYATQECFSERLGRHLARFLVGENASRKKALEIFKFHLDAKQDVEIVRCETVRTVVKTARGIE